MKQSEIFALIENENTSSEDLLKCIKNSKNIFVAEHIVNYISDIAILIDVYNLFKNHSDADENFLRLIAVKDNMPEYILEKILFSNNSSSRFVLKNQNISENLIRKKYNQLSKEDSLEFKDILLNLNTPDDIFLKISIDRPDLYDVCKREILSLFKSFSVSEDVFYRCYVAKNRFATKKMLKILSLDFSEEVRAAVALNKNTSKSVLKELKGGIK